MTLIWYIYSNDVVSGPFSTENIEAGIQARKWSEQALIWWKGQREWVSIETWRKDLKNILDGLRTNIQTTAWYVEHLGTQKGPMNAKELQSYAQSNGIIGSCRVWTTGMDRWMSVFEINELVSYFGITRRKYPRAPFKGDLIVKQKDIPDELIAHPGSISEGGLGVRGLESVKKGDELDLLIRSPLLVQDIEGHARVVYTNIGGYTGLEFSDLKHEYKTLINDYVNQFKD